MRVHIENLENIPMGEIDSFLLNFQCDKNGNIYKLPLDTCMSKTDNITETDILWAERLIKAHLTCSSLSYQVFYHYRANEFWILEEDFCINEMMYSFDIDYFNRSKYISLLKSINDCISKNGVIVLTVNNLPNQCSLTCHFYDHQENIDKARQILIKNNIEIFQHTNLEELTQGLISRKINQTELCSNYTEEQISNVLSDICLFPENKV